MAKNYTIEYLTALYNVLLHESNGIESVIEELDNGEGDMISEGKAAIKSHVVSVEGKLIEFKQDVRNLNYSKFKDKYLK